MKYTGFKPFGTLRTCHSQRGVTPLSSCSYTGKFTGRNKDRFIIKQPSIEDEIDWGEINQPASEEIFNNLFSRVQKYLRDRRLFVKDAFCGADTKNRLNVRVVSEVAYHALFTHNMFIRPNKEELARIEPDFTVVALFSSGS